MANLYDYNQAAPSGGAGVYATRFEGQTFTASATYQLSSIELKMYTDNALDQEFTVSVYATTGTPALPTGAALCSATFNSSILDDNAYGSWHDLDMGTGCAIVSGTKYAITMTGAQADVDTCMWEINTGNPYSGGARIYDNGGDGWDNEVAAHDMLFRVYGDPNYSDVAPDDKMYSKSAVAIGAHQVWVQTDATTMAVVSDASDDIDTGDPLNVCEGFQKAFIANKANLKVLDLTNTKIASADVGANPPDFGTTLTGGTSGAAMVVDYITSLTGAITIYGLRTTTATFSSGETVTGTDDDGNAISFAISANEVAPNHWYDWTVFGNDSSSGTMTTSAYLVCRYRGRIVLAGSPSYPHQWYMSKVGNPFSWLYGTNDPMSAVAGTNADAGEVGDIIRAMIPFGDDFLVFACANSIHLLDGDPVSGGSIDELDNTTGIFESNSWCIDGNGNLWFYGTGGLYKMQGGRAKPVNVSQAHLPNLPEDWAAVPGTHRIVLTYDPLRNGVLVSRTTVADGTNLNYWYDLKTEGFYPETYPTVASIFSSCHYDSDTVATRGLLLGGKDGYLRNFYDADKNDDAGASDTAISSYVCWPILHLAEDNDYEGKLTSLTVEIAGGAAAGSFTDSDGVTYELHVGDDAETVLEDIKDGATPLHTGTLSGTGRKNRIRDRARGCYLGLVFKNSTAAETFAINRVFGTVVPGGKVT